MNKTKSEEPSAEIRLTCGAVLDGKYICAGEPLPFTREEDLPENYKPYIVRDESQLPPPICHNLYDGSPQPEPRYVYQSTGGSRGGSQQIVSWQAGDDVAALANTPLPEETREALQAAHDKRAALARAQLQYTQDLTDSIYEEAAARAPKFHVKRGADFVSAEKAELVPAENVFVRRPNGEYEYVGVVDSMGELPYEEIIP